MIAALVGLKDPRVVPMLARILQDSDPFGDDHSLMLETLAALATMRDDRAVPPIAALARKKRWPPWGKTTRLRERAPAGAGQDRHAKAKQAIERAGDDRRLLPEAPWREGRRGTA